jgi:hypothetical protein
MNPRRIKWNETATDRAYYAHDGMSTARLVIWQRFACGPDGVCGGEPTLASLRTG